MRVGALQAEEGDLHSQTQQAAWGAEVVVRGCGKQVDKAGVALDQRQDALIEGGAVGAMAQLDAADQLGVLCQQFVDRQSREAGVGRRVGAAGMLR